MIKELAEYIEDELGLIVGQDVIVGSLNETVTKDRAVAIRENSGGEANFYLDDQDDRPVDMICRGENQSEARDLADLIFGHFHRRDSYELPLLTSGKNYYIIYSMATAVPVDSGSDDRGRQYFTVTITFRVQRY